MVGLSQTFKGSRTSHDLGGGSIREVSLLALDVVSHVRNEGNCFAWAGRTYQIEALDDGGNLHIRPAEPTRLL